jgi:small-conductance mechanosensitive channel
MFKKFRFLIGAILGLVLAWSLAVLPISAQLPTLPSLPSPTQTSDSTETVVARCVDLQGRCLFKIAGSRGKASDRASEIEDRLETFSQAYIKAGNVDLQVEIEPVPPDEDRDVEVTQGEGEELLNQPEDTRLRNIFLSTSEAENRLRLMTVLTEDADLLDQSIADTAEDYQAALREGLTEVKEARQLSGILRRGGIAIAITAGMVLLITLINRTQSSLKRSKDQIKPSTTRLVSRKLSEQQEWNLKDIQQRLLQTAEFAVWIGGVLIILDLFPYTRPARSFLIYAFQIPLRFIIVGIVTYLVIRLSFVLSDRFTSALTNNYLLTPDTDRRLHMRVSTISSVAKGTVAVLWIIIGILIALSWIDIDIGPLLAGAGIIGLGLSLASQNLLRDAINGFFIILEDQYAVGDVIDVSGVAGFVENINLRITQLRDAEGRLITIPNSEVKIVANLSSHWSRANLGIPVGYKSDIDQALNLIRQVAEEMNSIPEWQELILEPPQILGVDDFESRGLLVRVWIKTQPLKQWDVSREFRRRIKIAFDEAGIFLPLPQQEIWFHQSGVGMGNGQSYGSQSFSDQGIGGMDNR